MQLKKVRKIPRPRIEQRSSILEKGPLQARASPRQVPLGGGEFRDILRARVCKEDRGKREGECTCRFTLPVILSSTR